MIKYLFLWNILIKRSQMVGWVLLSTAQGFDEKSKVSLA